MSDAPLQSAGFLLPPHLASRLTRAEHSVVEHLAAGRANREIALMRGSTESTVKHQLVSIYRKLAVDSRTRLMALILSSR
jgi:DNA-binding NarL/FixJ family response regulator